MMDGLAMAVWASDTGLLFFVAWRVARAIDLDGSPFRLLLHASLIAWSILMASTLMLGMIGLLVPIALEAVVAALSLVLYRLIPLLSRWGSGTGPERDRRPSETLASESNSEPEQIYLWAWGALGAVWLARVILFGLLEYPADWDTLNYHLPVVHAWLRARSLYAPDCQEWFVPGTNETIGLWLAGPFSGDFLVGLINLPAAFLLGLSVLELGRQVGLPAPFRHLTALVAVTIGVIVRQALTAKNDTAAAALFVAGLAYAFRHASGGRRADLWLAATSLGLLAGVKYYAVGYAAVAGGTWLLCRFLAAGWRAAVRAGVAGAVGGLLFGGYWYVRNILVSGTPFYPKGHSTATDALSQWRPEGTWGTTLLGNGSPDVFPMLLEALWNHAGPVLYLATLLLPGALVWLLGGQWWLPRQREPEGRWVARWGLAAVVVGGGLVWGVIPYAVEIEPGTFDFLRDGYLPVRFGLCFLAVGGIAVAVPVADCWWMIGRRWLRVALLAAGLITVAWHVYCLVAPRLDTGVTLDIFLMASVISFAGLVVREVLQGGLPRLWLGSGAVVAVVGGSAVGGMLAENWHAKFKSHYESQYHSKVFTTLEQVQPSPVKLYVAGYRIYPFAGSRRQVPVCREIRLMTEIRFLAYLHDHRVSHIVVDQFAPNWAGHLGQIRYWVRDRPDVFRPIAFASPYDVFAINRTALAERVTASAVSTMGTKTGSNN